jgi:hypothetical protein
VGPLRYAQSASILFQEPTRYRVVVLTSSGPQHV